jgi:hypothetical protein
MDLEILLMVHYGFRDSSYGPAIIDSESSEVQIIIDLERLLKFSSIFNQYRFRETSEVQFYF